MDYKGTLKTVTQDVVSGKYQMTFELEGKALQLGGLQGKTLRITAKQWREKRSLDANAYYWVLLGKLADALGMTKPRLHNLMLRRHGYEIEIGGARGYVRIPDTDEAEEEALEATTFHVRPTSQVVEGTDGIRYRTYVMLLGTSAYDSAQMAHLIDEMIEECKAVGIETLPPDEIERMKEDMRRHEEEQARKSLRDQS